MNQNYPFQVIPWDNIPKEEHSGIGGTATWQTVQLPGLRMRLVEYSPGYMADHWCKKGHIVFCLEGSFISELQDGESFSLSKDMSYVVSDDLSTHRSHTTNGVRLLIIDGEFLQPKP